MSPRPSVQEPLGSTADKLCRFCLTDQELEKNEKNTTRIQTLYEMGSKSISTISAVDGKKFQGIPRTPDGKAVANTVVSHGGQGPRDLWFFIVLISPNRSTPDLDWYYPNYTLLAEKPQNYTLDAAKNLDAKSD